MNEINTLKDINPIEKDNIYAESMALKFQISKAISKNKNHNGMAKNSNRKFKSSRTLKFKDIEIVNATPKEKKNVIGNNEKKQKDMNLMKMQNNLKIKKRKINNLEIELENCDLKENSNKIVINGNKTNSNTNTNTNSNINVKKKYYKSCLFCCISQNDSFSDN